MSKRSEAAASCRSNVLVVPGGEKNEHLNNSLSNQSDSKIKIVNKVKKTYIYDQSSELIMADNPSVSLTTSNIEMSSKIIQSKFIRINTDQTSEHYSSSNIPRIIFTNSDNQDINIMPDNQSRIDHLVDQQQSEGGLGVIPEESTFINTPIAMLSKSDSKPPLYKPVSNSEKYQSSDKFVKIDSPDDQNPQKVEFKAQTMSFKINDLLNNNLPKLSEKGESN
jgi:hypothetical protein